MEMLRVILASVCLFSGLVVIAISILGLYRFNYVLNRMHAAAVADTLGVFLCLLGLMFVALDFWHVMKLLLLIVMFWSTNPIGSHVISKVEILTNENIKERVSDES